jgi:class 3 adenylate cyclase/tetratricopeptide (TPR) repeat protein
LCFDPRHSYTLFVAICSNCGEENPDRFRLCGFCGTPLAAALPPQEVRKTVTIVFSDLKGSTNLGEALDSESLRELLSRYFDEMRAVLEEHGGRVEKYIGDAIMAVFGLPTVHEDDALRAVRAAAGMQAALATLNDELERVWGARLANRTGVNTGEIVAGDPSLGQRLVTGDAVNVAARLEQAAPEHEILLGETTYKLVRHAVDVEAVEPLELKGKAERVPAYRLLGLKTVDGGSRGESIQLVGRERELEALLAELSSAVEAQACRLVTVLGDAGVGKTRLTEELESHASVRARVLRGRCLSYGRGITFWPLVEMVKQAAYIREGDGPAAAQAKVRELVGGDREIAERVASAIGLSASQFTIEDLFWGVRRLIERLAAERPLVLIVEDVHWAETTFLDLIDQVHIAAEAVPVLIVCAARHELDELRPEWSGNEQITRVELGPLSEAASAQVVHELLGGIGLAADVETRIVEAAAGNPLFVQQLLSMLIDDGRIQRDNGTWVAAADLSELETPPTLQALLAARLELLTPEERAVIEPAAVVGAVFARAAVTELAPEGVRDGIGGHLSTLVRKHFIDVDPAGLVGEDAYRFHHILIRDAAYNGLLKRTRATLHERFADWAERVNRDRDREMEYEEIFGYHLEQAYRYLSELGPLDEHGRGVGERAAVRLLSAGRRAFARNDMAAAANLLRRAAELLPERDERRLRILPDLGEALTEIGELAWAELFLTEAVEAAEEMGDERLRAEAGLVLLLLQRHAEHLDRWTATLLEEAERAIEIFEPLGDHAGLARAWRLITNAHGIAHRFGEAAAAAGRAGEHARLAGDSRQETRAASLYAQASFFGPTPVAEAIDRCEQLLAEASDKRLEGLLLCLLAPLRAMRGEFDAAREAYAHGRALLEDIGGKLIAASTTFNWSTIELLAGDAASAERELRREYERLEQIGENYHRSTVAAYLAVAISTQGRYAEAEGFARIAEELATADDVTTQALWRSVRAQVLAQDDRYDEAIALAQEAVELLGSTDGIVKQGDALIALAQVLELAGKTAEARRALAEALALYEQKGNEVSARTARAALAGLSETRTDAA